MKSLSEEDKKGKKLVIKGWLLDSLDKKAQMVVSEGQHWSDDFE